MTDDEIELCILALGNHAGKPITRQDVEALLLEAQVDDPNITIEGLLVEMHTYRVFDELARRTGMDPEEFFEEFYNKHVIGRDRELVINFDGEAVDVSIRFGDPDSSGADGERQHPHLVIEQEGDE